MKYVIEKGYPIPRMNRRKKRGSSQGTAAALKLMKKGDSFAITTLTPTTRTSMYQVAKRLGIRILVSRLHSRVWRIQ